MTMDLSRRRFLLVSGSAVATLSVALTSRSQECGAPLPFVITVQANGAWDPTFLIDPVGGDAGFTPFATSEILSAGAIRYAPYTNDGGVVTPYLVGDAQADFFQKHAARAIVWNGVDNATVSHDVGPRVAFTGSTRDGLPSLSGLVAGLQGGSMPLAMFVSGGYASTGGLVPITRGGSLGLLQGLADPNRDGIHSDGVNELVRAATRERDARLALASQLPRARLAYEQILAARSGALEERFREIAEVLQRATGRVGNPLADTASGVLALMSSGATAAAHLSVSGFDTHTNHDDLNNGQRDALATLLVGLDYIIDAAVADPVLSSRGVLIVVGSDFGRTRYNDGGGKDHWPVTSMMAFGIGPVEAIVGGGKVIGATSPTGQNGVEALPVKVSEGRVLVAEATDPDAFKLTPAHVQLSLRNALGLCPTGVPTDPLRAFTLQVQPQEPLPLQS
jgi:uncharacterized protein (DUF1501 family)